MVLDEAPLGYSSTVVFPHMSPLACLSILSCLYAPWISLVSCCLLLFCLETSQPRKLFVQFRCYCTSVSSSRSFVWHGVGSGNCRLSVLVISTDGAFRLHSFPSPPSDACSVGLEPMVTFLFLRLFLRLLEGSCGRDRSNWRAWYAMVCHGPTTWDGEE